ncbi:MAG: ferredoxin family protein [Nostoc sp. DedQUE08]|uniref:4Fe-4S dicluster domain-containing protein n=1 Tax=unclassified Nostoc TaxID=2593658 RepID=UPI002AD32B93|nr:MULTISPECIES: ferredoxin family protein [unclassified Nostoc]MDZ8066710.1 ferredoxin family protein [Nostoc sp. DedQUE08]MDZ8093474.1 ferredoxin family protein [Nostoc sp. DedQUE05]MDZ8138541.1 ferredoxin family protein [Nostoc sp. DedQUE04]
MIEIVDSDRCIGCDICVKVCPRDVFDSGDDGIAVIARKSDCQTCFLCELYCPVDALYVSPYAELDDKVDTEQLITQNLLGSYTRNMGWHHGKMGGTDKDPTQQLRILNRVRQDNARLIDTPLAE